MAISITHTTVATGTNDPGSQISKDAWNESHTITLGASRILGRYTGSSGAVQEISIGSGLNLDSGTGALSCTVSGLSQGQAGARALGGV